MKAESEKTKASPFVLLVGGILALLAVSAGTLYWQQRKYIDKDIHSQLDEVQKLFNVQIREDAKILNSLADLVQNDTNIKAAWIAKNRSALLTCARPILSDFSEKYEVTHLYFHEPNEVCFLRVHDPANYNDRIHRFIVDEAVSRKEAVSGITLTTFGELSLRYAQPWYIDGNAVGFVELGRKIEHIASQLKDSLGVELSFVVKKPNLYREDWERSQKVTGQKGDWELMQHLVIAGSTLQQFPANFPVIVENAYMSQRQSFFDISAENRTYRAGMIPLPDAADNEIGKIVVMKDVTENLTVLHNLLAILTASTFLIGGILLVVFYKRINPPTQANGSPHSEPQGRVTKPVTEKVTSVN